MYFYLTLFALIPISTVYGACNFSVENDANLLCNKYSGNYNKSQAQSETSTDPQYYEHGKPGELGFKCGREAETDDCKNLVCFCDDLKQVVDTQSNICILPDGQQVNKAIRKEYRTLTDEERQRFHNAMWEIKKNGDFDELAKFYKRNEISSAAHNGPGFLPFHRDFLKRVEFALRRADHKVSIPFWDSTMDNLLPNSKDSIIWTDEFMGSTNGEVESGPFAGWTTIKGKKLKRNVGAHGKTMNSTDIENYLSNNNTDRAFGLTSAHENGSCTSYRVNGLEMEYLVGYVQQFVGGDMDDLALSANDPIFYLLYSFADRTWELWRRKHQSRKERESQYPASRPECFLEYHNYDKVEEEEDDSENMCYEFSIKTALENFYTDNLYDYDPSPECPSCGNSQYLFCHKNKCTSKIRSGGDCSGLENTNACYNSVCYNGECVNKDIKRKQLKKC